MPILTREPALDLASYRITDRLWQRVVYRWGDGLAEVDDCKQRLGFRSPRRQIRRGLARRGR